MAAGRRYYTLASQTLHAARLPKSTLITDTTIMLLPGQVHMPRPTPPPYVVAKTLTQYLFGEITLPSFLQRYGDILLAITGGAAAGAGLFWFFHRNKYNRKRIRLAVYHVVRTLQIMLDLEERMKNPEKLYKKIDNEVKRMIGTYLTESEGVTIARKAKRQLEVGHAKHMNDEEDGRRVRRRVDDAEAGEDDGSLRGHDVEEGQLSEPDLAGDVPEITVQSPSSVGQSEISLVHEQEALQEEDSDLSMLGYRPTASHLSPVRGQPSPTSSDFDLDFGLPRLPSSAQSRRSRRSSSRLGLFDDYSSSPPVRPSNPTPRRGRGGPYSSDDTPSPQRDNPVDHSSEDIPSGDDEQPVVRPSNPTPRRAQGSTDVQVDTPRPKTARGNRFDLDQGSHSPDTSPASRGDTSSVQESPRPLITSKEIRERREKARASDTQKTAVKPRNTVSSRQPPSAMAMRTEGEVPGHRLSLIRESLSPHVSPAVDAKRYRVAETRKLNRQLQDERNERRLSRKHILQTSGVSREDEEEQLAEAMEARRQEAPHEPSRSEIPSRSASIDPEVEDDGDLVHFEDATKYFTSAGPIVTASPVVRHDNPLPAAVAQSSSPRSRPSPQAATKGKSRRSAAPSPPGSTEKTPAKTPAAKAPAKTPAKTPAKRKTPPTTGTRKSRRIAKLRDEKK